MRTVVLSKCAYEKINSYPWKSRKTRDKAINILAKLQQKTYRNNKGIDDYLTLSSTYLTKVFGSKYSNALNPLIELGIIERNDSYTVGNSSKKGIAKGYRVSRKVFLETELIVTKKTGRKKNQVTKSPLISATKRYLRQLRFPHRKKIVKIITDMASYDYVRRQVKFNEEIKENSFLLSGQFHEVPVKKIVVLRQLDENQILVKYRDKFRVLKMSEDDYILAKQVELRTYWMNTLLKLKNREVYADRNDSNKRLDTNLTSLKSEFLRHIKLDGESLVSIDLKNSQFRLFVFLLEYLEKEVIRYSREFKTVNFDIDEINKIEKCSHLFNVYFDKYIDPTTLSLLLAVFRENMVFNTSPNPSLSTNYVLFKELVKNGTLYEEIAEMLSESLGKKYSREDAKKLMFRIAFASRYDSSQEKTEFKNYFPDVYDFIVEFKSIMTKMFEEANEENFSKKGNAAFPVLLQNIESNIFIDIILNELLRMNIKAFSKHDSIICKVSDLKRVEKVIQGILNEYLGKATYQLSIELFQSLRA